jgi:hypothetical protein
MKKHKTRDFNKSEFVKSISINLADFEFIDRNKKKKSKAGFLKHIIEFYKLNNK